MSRIAVLFSALTVALPALMASDLPARQTEAELRLALKEAQRLATTDPPRALEKLKRIQAQLDGDRTLPAERREQLARIVTDRLRVVAAGPVIEERLPHPRPSPEADRKSAEFAKLKSGMEAASALKKSGDAAAADKQFAELLQSFTSHLVTTADSAIQQVSARQTDAATIRQDKVRGALATLNSVDRAAVMPKSDVEFPKDWKEKIARRKADTAPTAEELRILRALNTSIDPRFKDSRLQDAMDYISTLIGLPIVIDKGALDELQLTYDTSVNFAVKKPIAARTALRAITGNLGLTYVVREGTVFVTTPMRAREFLVTKVYFIGDLVMPIGFLDLNGEAFNVTMLIDTIVRSIDPESWDFRGGPGVIRYYPPTRSLIIRQSAEIHTMIKGSLHR